VTLLGQSQPFISTVMKGDSAASTVPPKTGPAVHRRWTGDGNQIDIARALPHLLGAMGRGRSGDGVHIEEFIPMAHHEVLDQGPPDPLPLGRGRREERLGRSAGPAQHVRVEPRPACSIGGTHLNELNDEGPPFRLRVPHV
jgi:hypothetical protein